jgi:hypothetical protein
MHVLPVSAVAAPLRDAPQRPRARCQARLTALPVEIVSQIVDQVATGDLLNLARAWPPIMQATARQDARQKRTVPPTFWPQDPMRCWQIEQQQQRAKRNLDAGWICKRRLTGFCDAEIVTLAADGGFIQTWFDAQID